jgi:glycosyltransferase involved in cell wall biosynthesis
MSEPTISVVIPVFNRRFLVERAIRSVRNQPRGNAAEIVVIDDGSTDDTYELLKHIASTYRLVLLRHEKNRGICPTRNTGIAVATGDWIFPLDSDDELSSDALVTLHEIIKGLPGDVHQVRGMVQWDDGSLTPEPVMGDETWGYDAYLSAIDVPDGAGVESTNVYSKASLQTVRYPEDRSHETLFHLEWYRKFQARTTPAILRLYHTDAVNSTRSPKTVAQHLRDARDHAQQVEEIIGRHGAALKLMAPRAYKRILIGGVKNHMLAGHRARALALAYQVSDKIDTRLGAFLALGLIHRTLLAWVSANPQWWRR